ncbi:MAG TPA: fluoride efflux transporter CrcB [Aquificales bacterium]|uniref:Fluoride-specific ion channel FluC n=1 Tax=Aquifex aeolicus TaxID=63363 RepID=A0A9D0YQ08_AQUAO|nr:fluoride efflux transporter CrcB [Aquificales bacterium]HIP86659.1 fluoride efflux transporter CrcB [Aquifex sp.]HIP98757.1 fluoride efflux transporter CrcB [Aquifex aeolicus]
MWVWVALGGSIGAVLRYLVTTYVQKKTGVAFPLGTLTVNVVGSFIIGFFIHYFLEHLLLPPQSKAFFVVGFLGAFTTFSSFSYETVFLISQGYWLKAFGYVLVTNLLCFIATILGIVLARILAG